MAWPQELLAALVSLQALGAASLFLWLGTYNAKHRRRFEESRQAFGKKNGSLFELPAFRDSGLECQNPFENTTWLLTAYERAKLSLLAVTLFPLRLLGVLSTVVATYLLARLLLRLRLQPAARLVAAMGCRSLLFCFGFYRIRVLGRQAPGVGVLVSNHCSFLDGAVWMAVSTPRVFAEEGNFKHPVMQVFAEALGVVCFDRSGSESRRLAREKMASAASEAVAGNAAPILVFPEGTTKNLKTLITFKDGAFAPGLPVQAAVLRYIFRHCDPTWVFAGPGTPMLAFRLLCQVRNMLEIEFLPVSSPSEEEKRAPHAFARRVQLQVSAAMGVPVTEHAVEDIQFELAAVKAKLPAEVGVVGFSALKEVFSVDAGQIKKQMLVFKEMDRKGAGRISFEEFTDGFKRAFHSPSAAQTELLRQFFHQLTGGQPALDFRKFLIGVALVNESKDAAGVCARPTSPSVTSPPSAEDFVDRYKGQMYTHLAFAAFAAGSDSCISRREFEELWSWLHPAGMPPASEGPEGPEGPAPDGPAPEGPAPEGRQESEGRRRRRPSADEEVSSSARAVFEEIAGAGAEELPFERFIAFSERSPDFERSLRQAFFGRISSVLAPP